MSAAGSLTATLLTGHAGPSDAQTSREQPARLPRTVSSPTGGPTQNPTCFPGPAPLNPISNVGLRLPDLLSPRLRLGCFSKEQETGFISINLWLTLDPNGVTPAALGSSEKPRWRAGRALGWPGSRLPVSRGPRCTWAAARLLLLWKT